MGKRWNPDLAQKCNNEPVLRDSALTDGVLFRCFERFPQYAKISAKAEAFLINATNGVFLNAKLATSDLFQIGVNAMSTPPTCSDGVDQNAAQQPARYLSSSFERAVLSSSSEPCLYLSPSRKGPDFALKSFEFTVTPSCPDLCKSCKEWNRCQGCEQNAMLDSKTGLCRCKRGFYRDIFGKCTHILTRALRCGNAKIVVLDDLSSLKLKYPSLVSGWQVKGVPANESSIGRCGERRLLGGANILRSGDTVTKVWKSLPGHFKIQANVTLLISDKSNNSKGPVDFESIQLFIDNEMVQEVKNEKSVARPRVISCGADTGRAEAFSVSKLFNHNSPSMNLTVRVVLKDNQTQSWGVGTVTLSMVRCPVGCQKCSGCDRCDKCEDGFLQSAASSSSCLCPKGQKLFVLGGSETCEDIGKCTATTLLNIFSVSNKNVSSTNRWTINDRSIQQSDFFACGTLDGVLLKSNDVVSATVRNIGKHWASRVSAKVFVVATTNYSGEPGRIAQNKFEATIDGLVVPSTQFKGNLRPKRVCVGEGENRREYFTQEVVLRFPFTNNFANDAKIAIRTKNAGFADYEGWLVTSMDLELCTCGRLCTRCAVGGVCAACKGENEDPAKNCRCKPRFFRSNGQCVRTKGKIPMSFDKN